MIDDIPFTTPVLFLIFNRPECTQVAFEAIRQQKPPYLYIAADGPRLHKDGEATLCELTRETVLNKIDWDCEVKTLFRETNLGCGKAVSQAITWFFEQVEEGIILVDDCLPNISFFYFCQEMLTRYRNAKEIMHIGGSNFQKKNFEHNYSYYFSNYIHIWGWATWRRAWQGYQLLPMKNANENLIGLRHRFPNKIEREVWNKSLEQIIAQRIDTWDTQWVYHIYKSGGLGITPAKNLVSNIGFDHNATHTHAFNPLVSELPVYEIIELIHPKKIKVLTKADNYTFKNLFQNGDTRYNSLKFKIGKILPFLKKLYLKFKYTP